MIVRARRSHLADGKGLDRWGSVVDFLLPVPYVSLLVAATEVARMPTAMWTSSASAIPAVIGRSVLDQAATFPELGASLLAVSVAIAGARLVPRLEKPLLVVAVVAGLLAAKCSHMVLVRYPKFEGYAPFVAAWTGLGLYLAAAYAVAVHPERRRRSSLVLACIGAIAAVGAYVVHARSYADAYPTLHTALLSVTFLTAHASASHVLGALRRPRWLPAATAAIAVLLVPCTRLAMPSVVGPYYYSMTVLGRTTPDRKAPEEPPCAAPPPMPPPAAEALFRRRSGMPALPPSFHVDDYNVLFVLEETLRFDETSVGGRDAATPTLQHLVEEGAFAFERAYAPSSVTLASTASVLSMTYPSSAPLTIHDPFWTGDLRAEGSTVAELFAASGYATFRVVHGIGADVIRGLGRGFQDSYVEPSVPDDLDRDWRADESIASHAVEQLRSRSSGTQKFFGFVFFGGPHEPYAVHDGSPGSERDRYRQEVAHTDAQLGRIVRALEETGLIERTVVIVAADHGEEFGEHGGFRHGRTLYEESLHVPLLVAIPHLAGKPQAAPVSLVHVLPWLLSTAKGALGARARELIRALHGPVLEATDGAVVAELLGKDRMKTALMYPDATVIYDHLSGRYEAFDTSSDPLEKVDLVPQAPRELSTWISHVDAYRRLRACTRRFRVE